MFLIDTNVLILASKHSDPDYQFLRESLQTSKVCISTITIAEFLIKATRTEKNFFEMILTKMNILIIDEAVARQAADYRSKFLKSRRIVLLDYLIAAQAKIHKLTLATNNKADFHMKDLKVILPRSARS